MKKFISILLVAMLLIGMFPATALTAQAAEEIAEISFANNTQRDSLTTTSQVWSANNVTFTNNKKGNSSNVADYTNPVRLYKGSEIVIACESGTITQIVFVSNGTSKYKTSLQTSLTNAGKTPTVSGNNYTITFSPGVESFTFDVTGSEQVRLQSLAVTYEASDTSEPVCTHPNAYEKEGTAVAATCTTAGKNADVHCPDCDDKLIETGATIDALGHNYVDGICTKCGAKEFGAGSYYIAAYRDSEEKYYYMTSTLVGTSTKRYSAEDTGVAELPTSITNPDDGKVFVVVAKNNGYSIYAKDLTENNYLGWTSGNSGALVAEGSALTLAIEELKDSTTGDTYYNIINKDAGRYLSLNEAKDSNYFAWYAGTQKQNLILIPVVEAEAEPVAEVNGTEYTSIDDVRTAIANGGTLKLLANVDTITVNGDLQLDLNGHAATNVSATNIYGSDSTATSTTAGNGTLTVTSGTVVIDNNSGTTRYIALKDANDVYTFHVLDLKVNKVTLRTQVQDMGPGIYYKAIINCDTALAGATESYGIALSTQDMPGTDFTTETNSNSERVNGWTVKEGSPTCGEEFTSGSVFNIFKYDTDADVNRQRGEITIYANAYIKIGEAYIMTNTANTAFSLKDVMVELNKSENFDALGDKKSLVGQFYLDWEDAMTSWSLDNIADYAATMNAAQ